MKRWLTIGLVLIASTAGAITLITKPYTFVSKTVADPAKVNSNFDTVVTGVNAGLGAINTAAGTKSTLANRLNVSLNADGTFKNVSGVTAGSQWSNPGLLQVYSSARIFKIVGADHTDIYLQYRRVKAILSASTVYSEVSSSAYTGGDTVVTLADAVLTSPVSTVDHSTFTPNSASNSAISKKMVGLYRGALVYNNATTSADTDIPFASESYDTDSIHSTSVNTGRLTVPAGVTKVKVSAVVYSSTTSGSIYRMSISKNAGADTAGLSAVFAIGNTSNYAAQHNASAILTVTAGDYFTVRSLNDTSPGDAVGIYTWFAMEIIE